VSRVLRLTPSAIAVLDYVDRHVFNHGTFPDLSVGMMREIEGWPVRNPRGGANIAYFPTIEEANQAISAARKKHHNLYLRRHP
jgi:hypothetical protein